MSETSSPGCDPASGPHPDPLLAVRSDLRSGAEDSEPLAGAGATAPGTRTSRPGKSGQCGTHHWRRGGVGANDRLGLRCSFLRACGLALRTGAAHNTHCAFVPLVPRFTTLFLFAPTLLTREPLRCGNKATHNVALGDAPLLHCHADCSLTSRKVSAVAAPVRRHRSRQHRRFARGPVRHAPAGSARPKATAPPRC